MQQPAVRGGPIPPARNYLTTPGTFEQCPNSRPNALSLSLPEDDPSMEHERLERRTSGQKQVHENVAKLSAYPSQCKD